MTRHPIQRRAQQRARGFTLVELLVSMTVIAILVGILAVAIGGVFRRTGLFTVQQEMNQIQGAIERFKTQYGFYPPSFKGIMAGLDMNNANDRITAANRILPFLNRISPNHSETATLDGTNNTPRFIDQWFNETGRYIYWGSGEDLVFWLSGLNKNKQFPLTGGLQGGYVAFNGQNTDGTIIEREVFFDFKPKQLQFNPISSRSASYVQASGSPAEVTNIDGSTTILSASPFLYLDSNNYLPLNPGDEMATDGAYVRPGTTLQNIIDAASNSSIFQQIYENPTTYQLVTFGLDGLPKTDTGLDPNPNDWSKVGPAGVDNVVNFAGDGPNTLETMLLGTN